MWCVFRISYCNSNGFNFRWFFFPLILFMQNWYRHFVHQFTHSVRFGSVRLDSVWFSARKLCVHIHRRTRNSGAHALSAFRLLLCAATYCNIMIIIPSSHYTFEFTIWLFESSFFIIFIFVLRILWLGIFNRLQPSQLNEFQIPNIIRFSFILFEHESWTDFFNKKNKRRDDRSECVNAKSVEHVLALLFTWSRRRSE